MTHLSQMATSGHIISKLGHWCWHNTTIRLQTSILTRFVCVHICVCLLCRVLCCFTSRRYSCNHNQSQDTELFHHHERASFLGDFFVVTLSLILAITNLSSISTILCFKEHFKGNHAVDKLLRLTYFSLSLMPLRYIQVHMYQGFHLFCEWVILQCMSILGIHWRTLFTLLKFAIDYSLSARDLFLLHGTEPHNSQGQPGLLSTRSNTSIQNVERVYSELVFRLWVIPTDPSSCK